MKQTEPDYGKGSVVEIPGTLFSILGAETELPKIPEVLEKADTDVENVVFLLVDALGIRQWEGFDSGIFSKIQDEGFMTSITSTFPSATPVTLTSLHTGSDPIEHSLLGWEMYYEELGSKILTLPFRDTDWNKLEADPEILFEGETVYSRLEDTDIEAYALLDRKIADSDYSSIVFNETDIIDYVNIADMTLRLRRILEGNGDKFVYSYISELDEIDHLRGPMGEGEKTQLEMISRCLEKNLVEKLDEDVARETLLVVSADHGQIEGGKETDLMEIDKVRDSLRTNSEGDLITPCGTGRSVFLHIKQEKIEELKEFLQEEVEGKVMKTKEAVERGLFGTEDPGEKFYERAGDLLIIPDGNEVVWFDTDEIDQKGYHGGLTRHEMEVPIAAVKISQIKQN